MSNPCPGCGVHITSDGDISIPLRDRDGNVIARTFISPEDAAHAQHKWQLGTDGYVRRSIRSNNDRVRHTLHREISAATAEQVVDHINGDRLDNRRHNLRAVTQSVNLQNRGPNLGRDLPRMVYRTRSGKFRVQTKVNGRSVPIATCTTVGEADEIARAWRADHMPFSPEGEGRVRAS